MTVKGDKDLDSINNSINTAMSIDKLQIPKSMPTLPKSGSSDFTSPFKPKETINPQTFTAVTLDDISVKLSKLLDLDKKRLILESRRLDIETKILKELEDEADEGQELTRDGTVLSTDFTFIELGQLRQGLRVKSFELANDDTINGIYFGWNVTESGLQPSVDDTTSSLSKFRILNAGDSIKIVFNRKVIQNIALLGQGGDAVFRLWMVW